MEKREVMRKERWIYSFRLCPEVPSLPAYLTEHESLWWLKKHSTSNKCNPRFYITMPLLEVHLSWGVQIMGIALMTRRGSHSTKTSKMILNLIGIHWLPSSVGTPQGNKGESVCLILLEQKGKEQLSGTGSDSSSWELGSSSLSRSSVHGTGYLSK